VVGRAARHDKGRQEVERIERLMQAPEGSPEWKSYWQNPKTQEHYRQALALAHNVGTEEPGELSSTSADPAPAPAAPAAPPGPAAERAGA
jgi:hypothetical protein